MAPFKLRHPENTESLTFAASLIGAAAAATSPLEKTARYRSRVRDENWRRLKAGIGKLILKRTSMENGESCKGVFCIDAGEFGEEAGKNGKEKLKSKSYVADTMMGILMKPLVALGIDGKLKRWTIKVRGGSAAMPPTYTWTQTGWTLIGILVTILILSKISWMLVEQTDGEYALMMAPLGALTAMHFALTPAPAASPRNTFFSQLVTVPLSIGLSYLPIDPWLKPVLALAIVVPGLAKCGLTHPPAASAAVVYSSGKHGFKDYGIFLAANCIAIVCSVVINNLSDKRQYPTSWPFINLLKAKLVSPKRKN